MRDQLPPHLALAHVKVKVAHVQQDERFRLLGELFGRLPAGEHLPRDARALFGVGVEVAVAVKAVRLAHVVQKGGKADVGRGIAHAAEGMFQNVVLVEVLPLIELVAQRKLGSDFSEDARFAEKGKPAVGPVLPARLFVGRKDAAKLLEDALGHDVADEHMIGSRPFEALFVGGKARLGGDARKAHEPQPVLAEYLLRGRDGAQDVFLNVGDATQRVDKFVLLDVVIDGVGAEIAAHGVLFDVARELRLRGGVHPAHIGVAPKARELIFRALAVL